MCQMRPVVISFIVFIITDPAGHIKTCADDDRCYLEAFSVFGDRESDRVCTDVKGTATGNLAQGQPATQTGHTDRHSVSPASGSESSHAGSQSECSADAAPSCMTEHSDDSPLLNPADHSTGEMALVLYDESVISPFHKDERKFSFGDSQVVIKQNWQQVGVAAVVWDAAVVLGEYITKNTHLVRGKRVLELGAGTGLAGIVAAIHGGVVTLTDRQMALETLEVNTEANRASHPDMDIAIRELEWGTDYDDVTKHYDIILGADIIYIEDTFDALLRTLGQYSGPTTHVLLSCKIRYDRDTNFLELLKQHFTVREIHHDRTRDIFVFEAHKKSTGDT